MQGITLRTHWTVAGCFLATVIASALVSGCGEKDPTQVVVPPDATVAAPAGAQASTISELNASDALVDEVEAPFTNAAGDFEGLGAIGAGDTGVPLKAGQILASGIEALGQARLGEASVLRRNVIGGKAGVEPPGISECASVPDNKCESTSICVEATEVAGVSLVVITQEACTGSVARTEHRFHVDDNGTPDDGEDDLVRSFWSLVELQDGTEFEVSMQPQEGDFIVDGAIVDLSEIIRPSFGPVQEQSNTMTLNVGQVDVDGDETILSLAANVAYRNGATAGISVFDEAGDGITDDDVVEVTSTFTAAPGNRRVDSITTVIVLWVHTLDVEEDDAVASLSRTTVYDGQTTEGGSPTSTTTFVPSSPVRDGEEPCGGTFERHATFPDGWNVRGLDHVIARECEGGGSAQLDVTFSDDTTFDRTITWSGTGMVTLAQTGRDGTTVNGSFDHVAHTFTVDTTFPDGNDPVSAHQEGSSNRDAGTRSYLRTVTWQSGQRDSLSVESTRDADGRTVIGYAVDERGRVDFSLEWDRPSRTLTGSASGPSDETGSFTIVRHEDGSADMTFTWSKPSEDLVVVGEAAINPDGSGCGELTATQGGASVTIPFCFEGDGRGMLAADGGIPF